MFVMAHEATLLSNKHYLTSCEESERIGDQGLPPQQSVSSYTQLYKLQVTLHNLGTAN